MTFEENLDQALHAPDRLNSLRSLAITLLSQGQGRVAVLKMFEGARQRLRQAGREAEEDAVMDVMDFVTGWCSPHMKLSSSEAKAGKCRSD
jgi:hypothetical protein